MTDPWGRGRYGAVLDANNDGYPDIFYGTESLRPDGMPSIDRFYINTGQGSFVDDPAMGLDMNIGSLCAHTVDYNSDGWPDLLVCGETGGLHLFQNDQGHGFSDVSSILGTPIKAVDAAMVDVNHDNLPDLITLTGSVLAERLQHANGTFGKQKILLKNIKSARSLAIGDVNGDNNPDIYVVCGRIGSQNAPDSLLARQRDRRLLTTDDDPGDNRRRWRHGLPDRLHPRRAQLFPRAQRAGPQYRPDPASYAPALDIERLGPNGLCQTRRCALGPRRVPRALERGAPPKPPRQPEIRP